MLHIKPFTVAGSLLIGEVSCDSCNTNVFKVGVRDATVIPENDGRSFERNEFDFNDFFLMCANCGDVYHIEEIGV